MLNPKNNYQNIKLIYHKSTSLKVIFSREPSLNKVKLETIPMGASSVSVYFDCCTE